MSEKNSKPSTTSSTRSKRSTASATAIKKNRWLRLGSQRPELPEFNQFFDLYWGGPERRITGLTLRIIGVNAIALLILVFGMLYLSQYQSSLIESKLETFKTEAELVATAISNNTASQNRDVIGTLSRIMNQRIRLFDAQGALLVDSNDVASGSAPEKPPEMASVQTLKNMASAILNMMPERQALPSYPASVSHDGHQYPDVPEALQGQISLSAWHNNEGKVFLSAAAPVQNNNRLSGAILLTRSGGDIEEAIGSFWVDILKVFGFTLIITTLLSIYLSGVIARPLRRLARAAEDVRTGHARPTDIPDLSHRHDEIGELSLVLRDMTSALWDRMDAVESFAADVAHELKNPLTSLRSAVETALIVKKQEDKEKLWGIIIHDLQRLDRLISDISSASRLEAELSREEFRRIDLQKALSSLMDVYKDPLARRDGKSEAQSNIRGIKIYLNCPQDTHIWGVESRLMQVFDNLLSNAMSFSPDNGSIKIDVGTRRQRIAVSIEDQGPGIPQAKLETVFERFYSERPRHEDYGQHSGLGLSISRQIVDAHNGIIFAENAYNESGEISGARFTVLLQPVVESA